MNSPRSTDRTLALWLVSFAMVASAVLLLYWGRDQVIRGDEIGYAARLANHSFLDAVLQSPPNKYFIAVPLLLYDAMFNLFGLGADLPYRVVSTALVLVCAGLFFVIARRRVGDLLAIAPTILLLFFGAGWETVLTPIRIPSLMAVAAGLGAIIVVERRSRRADIAAALLLSIAVASHPVGLAFLVACGILVLARPAPERWTGLWVLAVPVVVFGAWWLFGRSPSTDVIFPTRPIDVVTFALDSWVAIVGHVSGLAGVIGQPTDAQTVARAAAALLFAILVAVVVARRGRAPASFWAALAALVVLVVSTRLAPAGFLRSPEEVRYLYPEGVLFLWLLAELLALAGGLRAAAIAVTVVLVLGLIYNVDQLRKAGPFVRADSQVSLGQYSAYEIAGPALVRGYSPRDLGVPAGAYVDAAATYGSAAGSPADLRGASPLARRAADDALVGALGIEVQPTHRHTPVGLEPRVVRPLGAVVSHRAGCVRLRPSQSTSAPAAPPVLLNPNPSQNQRLKRVLRGLPATPTKTVPRLAELAPQGDELRLRAPDLSQTAVLLGRFLQPPQTPVARPPHATAGTLALTSSGLDLPWQVTIAAARPVTVCGMRSG